MAKITNAKLHPYPVVARLKAYACSQPMGVESTLEDRQIRAKLHAINSLSITNTEKDQTGGQGR